MYDDNFGWYDEDVDYGDEDVESRRQFYNHIQETNVEKICRGCGRTVMIQPHYAICNSCAEILERGGDIG
jgi:hypothetical protein